MLGLIHIYVAHLGSLYDIKYTNKTNNYIMNNKLVR